MKPSLLVSIFLLSFTLLHAQILPKTDTTASKAAVNDQLKEIKKEKIELHSDSTGSQPKKTMVDTTKQNKYGDLLNDDTAFNKKYSFWKPGLQVLGGDLATFLVDRFLLKYDYSIQVGFMIGHSNN